jgi:hypothetical protein
MLREISGVGTEQAAETLAELRSSPGPKMKRIIEKRIIEKRIILNPAFLVNVNKVMRRKQIAHLCDVFQPPPLVVRELPMHVAYEHFYLDNR